MFGGTIFRKQIADNGFGTGDNCLIIDSKHAYQAPFSFGDNWNKIKLGMFLSFTSGVENDQGSISQGYENAGGISSDTFNWIGLVKNAGTKSLPLDTTNLGFVGHKSNAIYLANTPSGGNVLRIKNSSDLFSGTGDGNALAVASFGNTTLATGLIEDHEKNIPAVYKKFDFLGTNGGGGDFAWSPRGPSTTTVVLENRSNHHTVFKLNNGVRRTLYPAVSTNFAAQLQSRKVVNGNATEFFITNTSVSELRLIVTGTLSAVDDKDVILLKDQEYQLLRLGFVRTPTTITIVDNTTSETSVGTFSQGTTTSQSNAIRDYIDDLISSRIVLSPSTFFPDNYSGATQMALETVGGLLISSGEFNTGFSGSLINDLIHPNNYQLETTGNFCNYVGMTFEVHNKGTSDQRISMTMHGEDTAGSIVPNTADVSLDRLKALIEYSDVSGTQASFTDSSNASPNQITGLTFNNGVSAYDLPDSFFFYNALPIARPRIHAWAVKKLD